MAAISPHRKIPYHHYHVMRHKPQSVPTKEPALIDQDLVDKLLVHSVKTICEEVAVEQGIEEPFVESVVLESMVAAADEFILQLLSKVRRSMHAARRTCPIVTDFDTAFEVFDIPRPDDQLRPYKTQPEINAPLYPTPPPEDEFHNLTELPPSFLGPELDGHGQVKKFTFATKGLPGLPSGHTYKDTAVFPLRESDTRKIRELATHEGKLGEQALRKLAGAVKLDASHSLESVDTSFTQKAPAPAWQQRRKRWKTGVDTSEAAVFEETLRDLLANEPGGFELGPIVTCEKAYRMPDDAAVKRKAAPAREDGGNSSRSTGDTAMEL